MQISKVKNSSKYYSDRMDEYLKQFDSQVIEVKMESDTKVRVFESVESAILRNQDPSSKNS